MEGKDFYWVRAEPGPGPLSDEFRCYLTLHGPYYSSDLRKKVTIPWGHVSKRRGERRFKAWCAVDGSPLGAFWHMTKAKEKLLSHVVKLALEG